MAVNLGIDLGAFREISLGNYNIGNVVIGKDAAGKVELTKVNNHKWQTWKNSVKSDATQNSAVREAFYAAIVDAVHGKFGFGTGKDNDLVNAKLHEIYTRLYGEDKSELGAVLTRELTHEILQDVDKFLLSQKDVGGVKQAYDDPNAVSNQWNFGNAKTIAQRAGVPVAAVKRILRDEGAAVWNLLVAQKVGDAYDAENAAHQAMLTNAIRQLAGANRLSAADYSGNANVASALEMLNSGFSQASISNNADLAERLCKKLTALDQENPGGSLDGEGKLAGLKFTKQKNGTLSVSFAGKQKTFTLPVSQHALQLERALVQRSLSNPQSDANDLANNLLNDLCTRWDGATAGDKIESYELNEHCRAVATAVLSKKIDGVTPKMCARIRTSDLMTFLKNVVSGQQPSTEVVEAKVKPSGDNSAEFDELLHCYPANNVANNVEVGNLSKVEKANKTLSEFALISQQDDKFKEAMANNGGDLIDQVLECKADAKLYGQLSPLSKTVVDGVVALLTQKVKDALGPKGDVKFWEILKEQGNLGDLSNQVKDKNGLRIPDKPLNELGLDKIHQDKLTFSAKTVVDTREKIKTNNDKLLSDGEKIKNKLEIYWKTDYTHRKKDCGKAFLEKVGNFSEEELEVMSGKKSYDCYQKLHDWIRDSDIPEKRVAYEKLKKQFDGLKTVDQCLNSFGYTKEERSTFEKEKSKILKEIGVETTGEAESKLAKAKEDWDSLADKRKKMSEALGKVEASDMKSINKLENENQCLEAHLQKHRDMTEDGFNPYLLLLDKDAISNSYVNTTDNNLAALKQAIKTEFDKSISALGTKLNVQLGQTGLFNWKGPGEMPAEAKDNFEFLKSADDDSFGGKDVYVKSVKWSSVDAVKKHAQGRASDGCIDAMIDPTRYYVGCVEKDSVKKEVEGLKGDTFDLLAATIVSPEKLRACFPDEANKPSVEGAFGVVHTMLSKIAGTFRDFALNLADEDGSAGRDAAYENLKLFMSGNPPALNAKSIVDAVRASMEKLNNGSDVLPIDRLLRRLPGPVVSHVLKNLCRYLISRENYGQKHSDASYFNSGSAADVFKEMGEWRGQIGDLKDRKTPAGDSLSDIFQVPEKTVAAGNLTRFDQLDPDRVEQVRKVQGQDEGGVPFVKNLIKDYVQALTGDNCNKYLRNKVMTALANGNARLQDKDGEINWSFFGEVVKGFGPIMQKYLQGVELPDDAPKAMRDVFNDIKSKLPSIPKDVVDAQIAHIKAMSGGRITSIELGESLGAATVGEAWKCKVCTVDNPKGEQCVIKFVRPDVRDRMAEERTMIDGILNKMGDKGKKIGETHKARFDSIERELDMLGEFNGIGQGEAYNGKSPDVVSVQALPFVAPSSNFVIMRQVEGSTFDRGVRTADEIAQSFAANNRKIRANKGVTDQDAANMAQALKDMRKTRQELLNTRNQLESVTKIWFNEVLNGSGFYHGDLHTGNMMTKGNLATLIDFGNFGVLSQAQQTALKRIFSGIWDKKSANGIEKFGEGLLSLVDSSQKNNLEAALKEKKLKDILSAGKSADDIFLRLQKALDFVASKGVTIPSVLSNFLEAQKRLANSMREVNQSLRQLDSSLMTLSGNGKWYLPVWPAPSSVTQAWGEQLTGEWGNIVLDKLPQNRHDAFDTDCKEFAKELGAKIKPVSYASVIGEIVKNMKVA